MTSRITIKEISQSYRRGIKRLSDPYKKVLKAESLPKRGIDVPTFRRPPPYYVNLEDLK